MKMNLLKQARRRIDLIDFLRAALLAWRYRNVLDVIQFKKTNNLQVVDGSREERQVKKARKLAKWFRAPESLIVEDLTNTIALMTRAEKKSLKETNNSAGSVIVGYCNIHRWRTSAIMPDNGDEPRCMVCHSPLKILELLC